MRKNRLYIKFFLVVVFTLFFTVAKAQCDPFFDPFCEDVDVPLDNEVIYAMVIAGVAGFWFIAKKKLPEMQKN